MLETSNSAKRNQKTRKMVILGLQTRESRELSFLNEGGGGKFLGCRKLPLPRFLYFGARVAHPGELTCHFFWRYHEYGPLRVGVRLLEPTQGRLGIHYLF